MIATVLAHRRQSEIRSITTSELFSDTEMTRDEEILTLLEVTESRVLDCPHNYDIS